MNKNQKLELTWIGKENQLRLEPRILIEDGGRSYGDKNTGNMLIYGDNLLALKALEQDFAAPSLLKEDKHGNWVIDERYNADMLAAAMAKHEGFKYSPDEQIYWKQGRSTEKDYIFTTTNFVTVEFLDKIHEEMQPDESLLICCKSFSKACECRHLNITVRKIPKMLLGRCEFGREDYSLNIVNMPVDEDEQQFEPVMVQKKTARKVKDKAQAELFVEEEIVEE